MKVRDGYKLTEVGMIPEEWDLKRLADIADVKGGKRLPKGEQLTDNPTKHPYIRVSDMHMGGIDSSNIKYVPDDLWPNIRQYTITKNDLFISVAGTLGIVGAIPDSLDGANLTENADKICNIKCSRHFLLYYLQSDQIKETINNSCTVCAQPKLAIEQIKGFQVLLPSLPEQQKIAEILSTVDEHISETEDLIAHTKTLKQGMMQRLLTKGIGHTEFKDTEIGRIPVEWEVVLIGSKGTTYGGLAGKDKYDFGSGSPFITYRSIFDSSVVDLSRVEYVHVAETEKQNTVTLGDLFFTTSSETPEEVGMCSALLDPPVEKMYLNSFCFGYRISDQSSFLPDFARFLFRGECFRSAVTKIGQGSTRYNLSKNAMMRIKIQMPPIFEQRQIASILSSIDDQIDTYQAKLNSLTRLKFGLMQQLLTGRIRVKV
jgi:type I restriction enzyme S subunit